MRYQRWVTIAGRLSIKKIMPSVISRKVDRIEVKPETKFFAWLSFCRDSKSLRNNWYGRMPLTSPNHRYWLHYRLALGLRWWKKEKRPKMPTYMPPGLLPHISFRVSIHLEWFSSGLFLATLQFPFLSDPISGTAESRVRFAPEEKKVSQPQFARDTGRRGTESKIEPRTVSWFGLLYFLLRRRGPCLLFKLRGKQKCRALSVSKGSNVLL